MKPSVPPIRLVASLWLLAVALPFAVAAGPASGALPATSVYRVPPLLLKDQDGRAFAFASLRGRPLLVGMFYGSCRMVCPLEIETLKRIGHEAGSAGRVPVLLVSFDPARDDVAMLQTVARAHRVQAPQFRLARPERGDEGMLAGVLGIAYRALPGGGFQHNARVVLLDADGRILATTTISDSPDPAFVGAVAAAAASP